MSKNQKQTEPIAKAETAAEIQQSLDNCREQFLALVAVKVNQYTTRKADVLQAALDDTLSGMIQWSEATIRQEHEVMWLSDVVRTLNVLTTSDGVLLHLRSKVEEMQDRSEMQVAHSSSMMANAVELAQREGLINVLREVRGWVKYMERRVELLAALR
jgi:hypothetical protein